MASLIEFNLFAPYNKGAALVGDFSNWEEIEMQKGKDGYFRTKVELKDGVYQYKFRVQSKSWFFELDQWVDVIDPYATDIDNPTQNAVVRIKDGDRIIDTYVWQHDDKPLPQDDELVIYEMHVGDFSGGEDDPYERGKYKHVVEKLDYLCELGINAIELMPVKEYPGDHSWGYNPRHFFATESSYGTAEGLKRLIDECHARGIRVIMDGIFNHSEAESPLTQIDHDYWYHHSPRDPDNNWGPEFNYEFYDENLDVKPAWKFISDTVRFWIQEYHIDGIRYDAARQIANYDFMHWIVQQAKETANMKPFYNVAELQETIDHILLQHPDWTIGAVCRDSVFINRSEKILNKDYNSNVQSLLRNPRLDLLIVQYPEDVLEREGMFYQGSNMVVLDNPTEIEMILTRDIFDDSTLVIKQGKNVSIRRKGLIEDYTLGEAEPFTRVYLKEIGTIL
jgi:1,4-alpha-glucan branching enzyme